MNFVVLGILGLLVGMETLCIINEISMSYCNYRMSDKKYTRIDASEKSKYTDDNVRPSEATKKANRKGDMASPSWEQCSAADSKRMEGFYAAQEATKKMKKKFK